MFNIYLGIYIITSIVIGVGGTFSLYKSNQTIGSILFLIGSFIVFFTFGLKWFSSNSLFSETPVSWPSIINTCPDYLVYYERKMNDGTTQNTCVDLLGVSKNGSLKLFPKDDTPPVNDDYYFSLTTKSTNPVSRNAELCQKAISLGLTWEGITNGESCISPSGTVSPSSSNNNGNNCPSS